MQFHYALLRVAIKNRDAGRGLQPRSKRLDASIAFETLSLQPPSQTFDIAIIFERSPKKHACFWLYSAVWMLQ